MVDEFYDAVESSNESTVVDAKQRKDQLLQCTKNNIQTTQTNWGELIRAAATNASLKHTYWPEVIFYILIFKYYNGILFSLMYSIITKWHLYRIIFQYTLI